MSSEIKSGGHLKFQFRIFLCLLLLMVPTAVWAAPTVTSFTPEDQSIAPISTTVTATFSEAMKPDSLTPGTFAVSRFVGLKAVAASSAYTVALKNDGTVVSWGNFNGKTPVPEGLSGVTMIAAGLWGQTIALKKDGTVTVWGQIPSFYYPTTMPAGLSGVTAVAAGQSHFLALKDNTVVAWGANNYHQLDVPESLNGVVTAIAAGGDLSAALKSDGRVTTWGNKQYGWTDLTASLTGVTAIAVGSDHFVALKGGGVVAWGSNTSGQCNVPSSALSGVIAIAAGYGYTMALKSDGTVVAWGNNSYGQTTVPPGLIGVTAIVAGSDYAVAVKNDGTMVGWGRNDFGQAAEPVVGTELAAIAGGWVTKVALKNDGTVFTWDQEGFFGYPPPTRVPKPQGLSGIKAVAEGDSFTVALDANGNVIAWGDNAYGQCNVPAGLPKVKGIDAGVYHTVALTDDGAVVAWGNNSNGGCNVPAGLSGVTAVAGGYGHTVALQDDRVVAWGLNSYGQCNVPSSALSGVIAIAAGRYHTVALKSDGTVVAWGSNTSGQCNIPTGLPRIVAIAAGGWHTLALTADGTVIAWGANSSGQSNVPAGLANVVAISAAYTSSFALKSDGTAVAWQGVSMPPLIGIYESLVQGTGSYDQGTNTATFTPSAPLELDATYFGLVNTGARSATVVSVDKTERWSFLTSERKAATITLDNFVQPYDGTPKKVTATVTPSDLPVVITYNGSTTPPTEPGLYHVVATVVTPNWRHYKGSAETDLHITSLTVNVNCLDQTYDGQVKAVCITTEPEIPQSEITVTYQESGSSAQPTTNPPIEVGLYDVVVTADGSGYHGVATAQLNIAKAFQPICLTLTGTSGVQGTITATGGETIISNSVCFKSPGTYPIQLTQPGNRNYKDTNGQGNLVITIP